MRNIAHSYILMFFAKVLILLGLQLFDKKFELEVFAKCLLIFLYFLVNDFPKAFMIIYFQYYVLDCAILRK